MTSNTLHGVIGWYPELPRQHDGVPQHSGTHVFWLHEHFGFFRAQQSTGQLSTLSPLSHAWSKQESLETEDLLLRCWYSSLHLLTKHLVKAQQNPGMLLYHDLH